MIALTEKLFSPKILDEALEHFAIERDGLVQCDGFCSFVYKGKSRGEDVILKLTHAGRLELGALRDELTFVRAAFESGAQVCAPRTATEQVLRLPDGVGGHFLGYLYEFVDGENLEALELDAGLVAATGEALGSFHAASQRIDREQFEHRRMFLEQELVQYRDILPADETDTLQCFDAITNALRVLPLGGEDFGMIHGDAHEGNFLACDNGEVCLIDFDEVEAGFYISDIATLFESFCEREGCRTSAFVEETFRQFLHGYSRHIEPSKLQWDTMELFMKFSWISDHCWKHHLYGNPGSVDFERRRRMRRALFRSDFAEDAFLHQFDYEAAVQRFIADSKTTSLIR